MLHRTGQFAGFTIVELLIVIVVIAVLAAITIVAFNGIQQRANAAASTSGLNSATKQIELYRAANGSYPAALSDTSLNLTGNTSFQYAVDIPNSSYCITATTGKISMYVSDTVKTPASGGCSGHGVNGAAAVTNLVTNPSLEVNTTSWSTSGSGASISRVTSGLGIVSGSAALEATLGTTNQSGANLTVGGLSAATSYTLTGTVTLISGDSANLGYRVGDGQGTKVMQGISLAAGTPTKISLTWSSGTQTSASFQFWRAGTSTGTCIVRLDAFMVVNAATPSGYADGSSSGWIWNGTPHNATSTGSAV